MATETHDTRFERAAAALVRVGRDYHHRGWALATSGNYSVLLGREPWRLALTPSGADKSELDAAAMLEIDERGGVIRGDGRPSAETALHLALVRRGAGAVLHTHSVWNTMQSRLHVDAGGLALEGFEMLKALSGVTTHEHREWLPIVENRQDIPAMAREIEAVLDSRPTTHAFLIAGHGLYTWGDALSDARRHVEALEFLLEVTGRSTARRND